MIGDDMNKGTIICGFKAIGKSTVAKILLI